MSKCWSKYLYSREKYASASRPSCLNYPQELFEEKYYDRGTSIFLKQIRIFPRKKLSDSRQNRFAGLSKLHFTCPERQFEENCNSLRICISLLWKCILHAMTSILGKYLFFFWKSCIFRKLVDLKQKFRLRFGEKIRPESEACILRVHRKGFSPFFWKKKLRTIHKKVLSVLSNLFLSCQRKQLEGNSPKQKSIGFN